MEVTFEPEQTERANQLMSRKEIIPGHVAGAEGV